MPLQEMAGSVRVLARCVVCYVVDTPKNAGVESKVMEPRHGDRPHLPGPSLYPIGFAAGVACILVGLIVNPKLIAPIGAAIAIAAPIGAITKGLTIRPTRMHATPAANAIGYSDGPGRCGRSPCWGSIMLDSTPALFRVSTT